MRQLRTADKAANTVSETQRPLTDAEQRELDDLTAAVTTAIEKRRDWLDTKMHESSHLHPGDDIYDLQTGAKLGKISELYRYWRDRDEGVRDTSHYCGYQYETQPRCFDNTTRQIGRSFGTRKQAISYAESRLRRI
jgi:hypothetical protein